MMEETNPVPVRSIYETMTEAELNQTTPLTNRVLKDIWQQFKYYESRIDQLQEDYENLERQSQDLQAYLRVSPSLSSRSKEPKIPDPPTFNGSSKKDILPWVAKCRMKFSGQPSLFPTESSKVLYAGSYLEGPPFAWFTPLNERLTSGETPEELRTFDTFVEALTVLYGEHNLKETAAEKLLSLEQNNDVPKYISQFEEYRQYVTYNDEALANIFYRGLKDWVKDAIVGYGERPKTLHALKKLALDIDGRQQARYQEKKASSKSNTTPTVNNPSFRPSAPWFNNNSSRPTNASNARPNVQPSNRPASTQKRPPPFGYNAGTSSAAPKAPPPAANNPPSVPRENFPSHTPDGTVPMELGASDGAWHITMAEKQRRRDLGLCAYCGKSGHAVHSCPHPPSARQSQGQRAFMTVDIYDPSSIVPSPSPSSVSSIDTPNSENYSLQE